MGAHDYKSRVLRSCCTMDSTESVSANRASPFGEQVCQLFAQLWLLHSCVEGMIPGILMYGFLWLVVFSYLRNDSTLSVEFAIMGSVIAVYIVMSLITGQLGAITAMTTYAGSVTCLNRLSKK